ncbi:metal ABC transporter substrate-binding protein [[Eubacterium] cellulosolvens]
MNKKQAVFLVVTLLIVALLVGVGLWQLAQNEDEGDKLKVVTTFYPLAYFADEIGGEKVSVRSLVPYNSEIHSWQPSVSDILAADKADVVLYNGANLDIWFEEDMLPSLSTSDKIIIETTEGVILKESQHAENETTRSFLFENNENGVEDENENDHDHGLYDPHTWISPFIAMQQAENIYEALIKADFENTEYYSDRWDLLRLKFEQLDSDYQTRLADKKNEDIFVTHKAYGYLAERYGFHQHGVIGISADEQPSVSTIESLVDEMEEHEIYVIYVDPIYSDDYAQTLKGTLNKRTGKDVKILKLYFMLGPQDGKDYFAQQEANLINLEIGLDA